MYQFELQLTWEFAHALILGVLSKSFTAKITRRLVHKHILGTSSLFCSRIDSPEKSSLSEDPGLTTYFFPGRDGVGGGGYPDV